MKTAVKFVQSFTQVGIGSYSAGEGAGFAPEVAEALIRGGVAIKEPVWEAQADLIAMALKHPDENVRRPAELLSGLPARLSELDERAERAKARITDLEAEETQAIVHGRPLPDTATVRAELQELARQRTVLTQQADYIFHDLTTALSRAISTEHARILETVRPVLRSVRDKVNKAREDFRSVQPDLQRLDALRSMQRQLDEMLVADLDDAEAAVADEFLGESITGVTGRRAIPVEPSILISAIAMHQQHQH